MGEFRVGDIVQAIGDESTFFYGGVHVGDVGYVVDIGRGSPIDSVGVDWGRPVRGHTCGGRTKDGYGTRVASEKLRLYIPDADETEIPLPDMKEVL